MRRRLQDLKNNQIKYFETVSEESDNVGENEDFEGYQSLELAAEELMQTQISYFSEKHLTETVDTAWSAEANSEIENSIQTSIESKVLQGAELIDAQCHESLCRVEIGFEDPMARDFQTTAIALTMPWEGEAFYHIDENDPLTIVYYVAREGEHLFEDNFEKSL